MDCKLYLLLFIIILAGYTPASAQSIPSKKELKKKYEHSDVHTELNKKFTSGPHNTPAGDSIVLNPLHYVNTYVYLDTTEIEFTSISADIEVKTNIPYNYAFYISPLCGRINKMKYYCGILTGVNGDRSGIFSRWLERDKRAIKTNGTASSSDSEGDFLHTSDDFSWDKGKYRVKLYKSGYIPGKPIPKKFSEKDLMFTWGEYEHSWVTFEVENLTTHEKKVIGSLAFPGKILWYGPRNIIFLEHYGQAINFAKRAQAYPYTIMNYKDLPDIKVDISNYCINGKPVIPVSSETHHSVSQNANQAQIRMPIPLLSKAYCNEPKCLFQFEVGKLQSWTVPKDKK